MTYNYNLSKTEFDAISLDFSKTYIEDFLIYELIPDYIRLIIEDEDYEEHKIIRVSYEPTNDFEWSEPNEFFNLKSDKNNFSNKEIKIKVIKETVKNLVIDMITSHDHFKQIHEEGLSMELIGYKNIYNTIIKSGDGLGQDVKKEIISEFSENLLKNTKPVPKEFDEIFAKNFKNLLA